MTAKLSVSFCGPSVSVQDSGRRGFMRFGVPHSGPMDRNSFSILRAALDTPDNFAAIEVSAVGGIVVECTEGMVTAGYVGGGFPSVFIDDQKLPPWSVFTLKAGMTLAVRPHKSGSWGYLGFCGEIQTEEWLGSRANLLNSGLCGRPLATGDVITISNALVKPELHAVLPIPSLMRFRGTIRAVLGPQDRFFSSKTISQFRNSTYRVSAEFDRMGMRLNGEKLNIESDLTMLSEALLRGAVQVPGHGDPIVLLSDHQTTGGYPKIATVITTDVNRLVQLRPGDPLQFSFLSAEEAVAVTRSDYAELLAYINSIPGFRGREDNKLPHIDAFNSDVSARK